MASSLLHCCVSMFISPLCSFLGQEQIPWNNREALAPLCRCTDKTHLPRRGGKVSRALLALLVGRASFCLAAPLFANCRELGRKRRWGVTG